LKGAAGSAMLPPPQGSASGTTLIRTIAKFQSLAGAGLALLLSQAACGGGKPKPTCDKAELVVVRIAPAPQLNPDREGYARSVVVRLYQLSSAEPFQAAAFEDLWSGATARPSDASVVAGPDELTLIPGRVETRTLKRNPSATQLGVTANFREHHPEGAWKGTLELPKSQDPCREDAPQHAAELTLELANYGLRLY
jgi:type VI secretion system VasD/TssJ family lipoprotein